MQHKNKSNFSLIETAVNTYKDMHGGVSPTISEIAEATGLARATAAKYLRYMRENAMLDYSGHRNIRTKRDAYDAGESCRVPVLGAVACGLPVLAEENIEEYVRLPVSLFGKGEYYILRAKGDSMIYAGIDDGDLVLIRRQDTAEYDQIVVALVEDEATLKRFRPGRDKICLHPENIMYDDIIVDSCIIQGVAIRVIKTL